MGIFILTESEVVLTQFGLMKYPLLSFTANAACAQKSVQICDANCRDHLYATCENEIIHDCGCADNHYIDEQRYCVEKEACGCYDFSQADKYIAPNQETNVGCMKW